MPKTEFKKVKWSKSRWYRLNEVEQEISKRKILEIVTSEMVTAPKDEKIRLLDIGCADGSFALRVAKQVNAGEIYGIEIDEESAKVARNNGIKVEISDANYAFPFKDSFFDIVVSTQVLEHVLETDSFFRETYRVLKPDGYAILATQNLASLHNLFLLLLGKQPISFHVSEIQVGNFLFGTETHGHIKIFTIPALEDLARYHGFYVEKTFGTGFYPFPYPLSKLLAKIFERYSVFIGLKARKLHMSEE